MLDETTLISSCPISNPTLFGPISSVQLVVGWRRREVLDKLLNIERLTEGHESLSRSAGQQGGRNTVMISFQGSAGGAAAPPPRLLPSAHLLISDQEHINNPPLLTPHSAQLFRDVRRKLS